MLFLVNRGIFYFDIKSFLISPGGVSFEVPAGSHRPNLDSQSRRSCQDRFGVIQVCTTYLSVSSVTLERRWGVLKLQVCNLRQLWRRFPIGINKVINFYAFVTGAKSWTCIFNVLDIKRFGDISLDI